MYPNQETITSAAKANFEANVNLITALTAKAIEGFEKLYTLNLTAAKASVEESSATARQILAAKDPQQLAALFSGQTKPTFDKAMAYNGHLANIATTTQAEFAKVTEEQFAEVSRRVSQFVNEATKSVPPGAENVVAMMKSAFGNATAGYEQFNKTAKQAVQAFESNVTNVASQFTPAANQAAS